MRRISKRLKLPDSAPRTERAREAGMRTASVYDRNNHYAISIVQVLVTNTAGLSQAPLKYGRSCRSFIGQVGIRRCHLLLHL